MDKNGRIYIAVIGAASCVESVSKKAYRVGELIGKKGAVLVCGGRGGVMEAASKGARDAGALVVGILPGYEADEGNEFLTLSIPTGLGEARNAIITRAADAVIAVRGGFGTLSEIGLALKMGKPVVGLETWEIKNQDGNPLITANNPEDAVEKAFDAIKNRWS